MGKESRVEELLRVDRLELPSLPVVRAIRAEPFVDSVGDQELRVLVVLDEATTDEQRSWKRLRPIRERIFKALEDAAERRYPYIRFLKESEIAKAG